MKPSTLILLAGVGVVGYLIYRRRAASSGGAGGSLANAAANAASDIWSTGKIGGDAAGDWT